MPLDPINYLIRATTSTSSLMEYVLRLLERLLEVVKVTCVTLGAVALVDEVDGELPKNGL